MKSGISKVVQNIDVNENVYQIYSLQSVNAAKIWGMEKNGSIRAPLSKPATG